MGHLYDARTKPDDILRQNPIDLIEQPPSGESRQKVINCCSKVKKNATKISIGVCFQVNGTKKTGK